MKKFLAVPVAVATLALTGGLITAPAQAAPAPGASVATAPGDLSPEQSHALLEKLEAKLPAGYETKFAATKARLGLQDSDLQKTAEQAINPDLKGAHLRWTRVQQYLETFYDLGAASPRKVITVRRTNAARPPPGDSRWRPSPSPRATSSRR
ncbi:MAG: hypothetical protein QOH84_1337 [Kribbellaceae bacterium]|nr:hypothetical protein [Kribbellaceae bacterium]